MLAEWRLVGRDEEYRLLRSLLTGGAAGVVLAGAAGVGKTRLGAETLAWADRAGFATARVVATSAAEALPFGALAPLLPPPDQEGSAVRAVPDAPVPVPGEAEGSSNWADLLRRFTTAIVERAHGRRFVLFVDDAHLLDGASAVLIHQLAVTRAAFVLVTIRSGMPAPDPITALWKGGLVERVELEGLTLDAVAEALTTLLGGDIDPAAVTQLWSRCLGNMLVLRELVLGAFHDGTLRCEGGIWRLVGWSRPPGRLVELVEARLTGLQPAERSLLEIVSFGEPLGPAELATTGHADLAENLERQDLVVSRRNGRRLEVRPAHPMYGEVMRARIPALRLPAIARTLAEAVEATGARRREDTLRVATWRLEGGGARPELMLDAAAIARWRYAFPLAERLARAAVEAGAGFEAALLVALLAGLQGRTDEAGTMLGALAESVTDDAQRGRVAVARLDNYVFYTARLEEGLRIAEEAEAAITDPQWRDEIVARKCGLVLGIHGPAAAAGVAEPLLHHASGAALGMAGHLGAYSLARIGRLSEARQAATRTRLAMQSLPPTMDWYPSLHAFFLGEALAYGGSLDEAYSLASTEYQRAVSEGSAEGQAWFAWQLAKMVGERGQVVTSARHAREGASVFHRLGRPLFESYCLTYLAMALGLAGKADEAAESLAQVQSLKIPENVFITVDTLQARAWAAAAGDELERATELLEESAALGRRIGDRVGEAAALHGLARLGRPGEVLPRLKELAALVEGELVTGRLAHAAALAEDRPDALERLSDAFAATGAGLLAAEASAHAAMARRRRGEVRRMTADEERAGVLAHQGEGIATPALRAIGVAVVSAPAHLANASADLRGSVGDGRKKKDRSGLTSREFDLLELAAEGFSNQAIADRLALSVNTVRTQFQRLLVKLGAHSKLEAVAVARKRGLLIGPSDRVVTPRRP